MPTGANKNATAKTPRAMVRVSIMSLGRREWGLKLALFRLGAGRLRLC